MYIIHLKKKKKKRDGERQQVGRNVRKDTGGMLVEHFQFSATVSCHFAFIAELVTVAYVGGLNVPYRPHLTGKVKVNLVKGKTKT